jgi:MraZ protein
MLIGEYRHSVDKKGRTSLPAKFKKEMGKVVYIARGLDGMIDVYTKESWELLQEKLASLPMTVEANRRFKRFILGGSSEAVLDKQGRVTISPALKEHARIDFDKKVVWVGVGDKAEIWSEER